MSGGAEHRATVRELPEGRARPEPVRFGGDSRADARRTWRRTLWLIVAFGAVCRFGQYAARPSYWHDEAFLVLNVFDKTAAGLMGPLDYDQAAPPAFLLLSRAAYVWFGPSEYAMRAVPLLAGLAALALFAALAWRTLPPAQAVCAVALIALSDHLIAQSATVKQYSVDVLATTVLLTVALAGWLAPVTTSPLRSMVTLSLAAAAALWVSHPSVFVFGALSLAQLPRLWSGGGRGRATWIGGNALVVVSFGLLYLCSVRHQNSERLLAYWTDHGSFPDYARVWMVPAWFARGLGRLLTFPFGPLGGVVGASALCGIATLVAGRRYRLLAALAGAIVLVAAAAMVRQYPFGGSRVTLFLAPPIALLSAVGGAWALQYARRPVRYLAALGGAVFALWYVGSATYYLFVPRVKSHIRPAVQYVQERRAAGETVHVFGRLRQQDPHDQEFFAYWRNPPPPVVMGFDPLTVDAGEQFWIVAAYPPRRGLEAIAAELQAARAVADEVDRYVGSGGAAIRFRARDGAATAAAATTATMTQSTTRPAASTAARGAG